MYTHPNSVHLLTVVSSLTQWWTVPQLAARWSWGPASLPPFSLSHLSSPHLILSPYINYYYYYYYFYLIWPNCHFLFIFFLSLTKSSPHVFHLSHTHTQSCPSLPLRNSMPNQSYSHPCLHLCALLPPSVPSATIFLSICHFPFIHHNPSFCILPFLLLLLFFSSTTFVM